MAASDAKFVPVKNLALRITFPILDADGDLVTGAASLDSEVSIDGAGFNDCTNEATEIATSSGMYFLDLTAAEMNGDTIAVIVKTATAGAKTTPIVLYTAARNLNDLAFPTVSGRGLDVSAGGEAGLDWANIGSPTTVQGLSGTTIKDATDVETKLGTPAGISVSADVAAVKGDTAAIKTKTDFLPSATAGAAGGVFIAGTNAPVTITGSGDALTLTSTAANGNGLNASGNGTGSGIKGTGGATGHGLAVLGGATSGNGINASTTGAAGGHGINALGDSGGSGLRAVGGLTGEGITVRGGSTSGAGASIKGVGTDTLGLEVAGVGAVAGMSVTGGATGVGLYCAGGGTSGDGIKATAQAGNSVGFRIEGRGTEPAILATGGATGIGIKAVGGSTSGAGMQATASGGGIGFQAIGIGANAGLAATGGATGDGVLATGGSTSGDGLRAVAATLGDGIEGVGAGGGLDLNVDQLPAALVSGRMDSSVGAMAANVLTASALATDAAQEIADELLKRDMSVVTGEAARSPLNALRFLRNKWTLSGGTLNVRKEDDATLAWTAAATQTAGSPVTEIDPA